MKKIVILLATVLSMTAAPALASDIGFGINLNVGLPLASAPAPAAPIFVTPPYLGFSVAVGTPFDLVSVGNRYYTLVGQQWYCGLRPGGPWQMVAWPFLPPQIRAHSIEQIRYARDLEYRNQNRRYGHHEGWGPRKDWQRDARRHDHGEEGNYRGERPDQDRRWHNDRD